MLLTIGSASPKKDRLTKEQAFGFRVLGFRVSTLNPKSRV